LSRADFWETKNADFTADKIFSEEIRAYPLKFQRNFDGRGGGAEKLGGDGRVVVWI